ncbi:LrgB family protein [Marinobacter vinifirmus]|jgi:predicted murein hydrolase (TIGR00659 family)|uniref:LrgB family protein n=1 Tax=Marinobacter vinifirmus TaxID=355591 RepID=A0A558BCX3_9GAMM|nr:LrgB family protein [Marinobacter vinifirmus]TVT34345.1 MAG: LrgB family protein [Marinobacter vinifirmus]HBO92350.1 LrgB family protein [Gammaproteobacteria bacterium]|tara:strand:- start:416 stop:1129 length:714 start_codon:yes stop_codon:yes gene_type:complete
MNNAFAELLSVWTAGPMLSIALTLAAFLVANWLFARFRRPLWMPPVLIAALLLAAVVALSGIGFEEYEQGARWLTVLLGPATVALGVPLYQQMHHIRALWKPILVTLPLAATLAAVYALGIAWLMGASPLVLSSLAPKSVTAPIAMGIAEQLGGSVSLTLGGLLITGVLASVFVDWCVRWLNIKDDRIIGFALGLNGHAIGTARAFEISPTAGAFSSLGMGLTGVFTALFLPFTFPF